MDLDAFIVVNRPEWDRLDQLAKSRSLTGPQADELVRLYQTVATHLSTVRSTAADPDLISELSDMLMRARSRITGSREPSWSDVARFFAVSLPAAFYRVRWWTLAVAGSTIVIAALVAVWVATTPEGLASVGSPEARQEYVDHQFADYYQPGFGFASQVWTNNAWITAQCIAFGISGVWPVWILVQNAIGVGTVAGLMSAYGELGRFFSLILPHGMLELTSVFIAGGAAFKLFWTMVSPGPRPRSQALAQEGRALFTLAIGLTLTLLLSGVVEGFVTGSALPAWLKIAIGAVALGLLIAYTGVFGRRAVDAGESGDLDEFQAGYTLRYAG